MKVSLYFALRELKRRPRRALSLIAVSAAILTTLIMMLLYFEADWRARVMPDHEENYHFRLYNLTEREKKQIAARPWVQATYEIWRDTTRHPSYACEFRVRVRWDYLWEYGELALSLMNEYDIWEREPYLSQYGSTYDSVYRSMAYGSLSRGSGAMTREELAESSTKLKIFSDSVKNLSFVSDTITTFAIRPEFMAYLSMLSLFLGATMAIILNENYRRDLPEYGALRALGMRRNQILAINLIESAILSIIAVPLSTLLTVVIVKLYNRFTAGMNTDGVYYTLLDSIPMGEIVILSLLMTVTSLIGTLAVALIYRNRPVMEMMRGSGAYQVSWVAKTSPKFEKSPDCRVYNRLYITRTRRSFALRTAVVAIMLPLPIYYFSAIVNLLGEGGLALTYHLLQALILLATSVTVIYVSSRGDTDLRGTEFAIFRALGMSKKGVRRIASPAVWLQAAIACAASILLYIELSDTTQGISSLPVPRHLTLAAVIMPLPAIAALVLPPLIGGMRASLRHIFKRSIIENIREME
ncbi:MAG: ABC transporter permease [Clostridia bacterium]|nr:ABC transporter permease [Clostridia bacterium]